jgi:hypothetical protein
LVKRIKTLAAQIFVGQFALFLEDEKTGEKIVDLNEKKFQAVLQRIETGKKETAESEIKYCRQFQNFYHMKDIKNCDFIEDFSREIDQLDDCFAKLSKKCLIGKKEQQLLQHFDTYFVTKRSDDFMALEKCYERVIGEVELMV